jgi:hypothetical protein
VPCFGETDASVPGSGIKVQIFCCYSLVSSLSQIFEVLSDFERTAVGLRIIQGFCFAFAGATRAVLGYLERPLSPVVRLTPMVLGSPTMTMMITTAAGCSWARRGLSAPSAALLRRAAARLLRCGLGSGVAPFVSGSRDVLGRRRDLRGNLRFDALTIFGGEGPIESIETLGTVFKKLLFLLTTLSLWRNICSSIRARSPIFIRPPLFD